MPEPDLTTMSPEELARLLGAVPAESQRAAGFLAEFTRRQTLAQSEAADAQVRAATAAEETARHTRSNARYLLWSVIVLMISALGTLAVSILTLILTMHSGEG